jgi:hypothetical protein
VTPNDSDRRRFLLATSLTLLALPALWFVARAANSGAPNVASVEVGIAGNVATTGSAPTSSAAPTTQPEGEAAPAFLDGPATPVGAANAEIAVPAAPAVTAITTHATYRSTIAPTNTCLVGDIPTGRKITVINRNNGLSVECISTRTYSTIKDGVVMHPDLFSKIANLTDAPIPVEIRQ